MNRWLPPSASPVPPAQQVDGDTRALIRALSAINHKIPAVGLALLEDRISPHNQRGFAWLMLEVVELLLANANRADGQSVHLEPPQ